jgi:hypothetical protein
MSSGRVSLDVDEEVAMPQAESAPKKRSIFAELKEMAWWQTILTLVPLALIGVGGVLGGLFGALAAVLNVKIAKSGLNAPVKAIVMVGVDFAAVVAWYVVAAAVLNAIQ